jgi:hypothetical protein
VGRARRNTIHLAPAPAPVVQFIYAAKDLERGSASAGVMPRPHVTASARAPGKSPVSVPLPAIRRWEMVPAPAEVPCRTMRLLGSLPNFAVVSSGGHI